MEAVQAPAPHPGRGAGGQRGAGQGDWAHPGRGGGGGEELQQRDVIGEGGVTPGRPVRAPQPAAVIRVRYQRGYHIMARPQQTSNWQNVVALLRC